MKQVLTFTIEKYDEVQIEKNIFVLDNPFTEAGYFFFPQINLNY